jgi:hypothetical protein
VLSATQNQCKNNAKTKAKPMQNQCKTNAKPKQNQCKTNAT